MNKISHIAILVLVTVLSACNTDMPGPAGTINQLEHDGAVLPVHIHGDMESKVALVVVHGGPGESAILKREARGLQMLEEEHMVVYYDQRGCGISAGNVSAASLSVEQMALDLNAVVELISAATGTEHIFIASLDWGAAVAVQYLASANVNPKVSGYLAVSPGFDAVEAMARSRQDIVDIATEFLSDGTTVNDEPARNIIAFYESNPVIDRFNYEEHYRLLETVGGIIINVDYEVSGVEPPAFIQSGVDHNYRFLLEHWSQNDGHFLENLDVSGDLGSIDVPVKLIWGAWDRLMPLSLALEYQDVFSDASSEELLSVFPSSANRPYLEEGDRFYATVATWMDFYD